MTKARLIRIGILIYRVIIPAISLFACLIVSPIYTYGTLRVSDIAEFGVRLAIAAYFSFLSWGTSNVLAGRTTWKKDKLPRYVRFIPRSLYLTLGVLLGLPGLTVMALGIFVLNTYISLILFPSFLGLFIGFGITVMFVPVWIAPFVRLWYSVYTDDDWEVW